ncbi:MAG TPA: aquaporin [Candidatus Dormibacteraeota bacterium]|nr:aquaporin [Candidatus Dormibacteraeota bacterium]
MNLSAKLLTELVGTFIFLSVIALFPGTGPAAPLAPLAIGSALMVMVYMGGHVSGAHYNPAVSLGLFLRRKIDAVTLVAYWVAQLVGGALAFVVGYLVSGHTPGIHPGGGVFAISALVVEVLFTTALVLVVLNVAATRATEGNSFYGLAIGFTIVAAAFVGGPISGGAFNPAVGFGATLGSALFAGGSWSDLWLYLLGPVLGGAIAAGIHYVQVTGVEGLEPLPAAPAVQEQQPERS